MTKNTKTPLAQSRKQLIFGAITATLVMACVVPIAAFAALDDGQYCITADGFEDGDKSFAGDRGNCPAVPGAGGGITPPEPTVEPTPVETIAPLPETTPTGAPEDPASCDLDAANSAAEDLSMRAMFSDPSSRIDAALRSSVYDTQPSVGYERPVQTTTLSVDKVKAAEAYCAGKSLAGAVSVDHFYSVALKTVGGFGSVALGSITGQTSGTLADTQSVLTRQTLGGTRTDGVYTGLEANLSTVVANEIRKDLGV